MSMWKSNSVLLSSMDVILHLVHRIIYTYQYLAKFCLKLYADISPNQLLLARIYITKSVIFKMHLESVIRLFNWI